jgi:hypothetical protein
MEARAVNDEDVKKVEKPGEREEDREWRQAERILRPHYGSSWWLAYASGIEGGWISGVTDEEHDK